MLLQAEAAFAPFPDQTFHCVVTSPPYWGLRKYAGEQGRIWGGDPDCEHEWGIKLPRRGRVGHGSGGSTLTGGKDSWGNRGGGHTGQFCQLCGAWYGGLGLEPTPELHIEHMVEIFREIRRVLRDDGCCWLNYGDCYSAAGWECNRQSIIGSGSMNPEDRKSGKSPGFVAGNLMMMPHKVAIALQNDGWIVRNDVIWWKRNPMPESVAGWRFENGNLRKGSWRHTRAHEYVFQLVKGPKMNYYSNQEAVREKSIDGFRINPHFKPRAGRKSKSSGGWSQVGDQSENVERGQDWSDTTYDSTHGRNPRSVLDVPTAPYKGAHYATFPPNLIAPLIRASCPKRCCPECGAPWAPVVERKHYGTLGGEDRKSVGMTRNEFGGQKEWDEYVAPNVTAYRPTCSCERDDHIPGICLDPFIGSGTTGAVARELGRRWVGLDISMEYLDQQAKVRALNWTPSKALEGLPLFMDFQDE